MSGSSPTPIPEIKCTFALNDDSKPSIAKARRLLRSRATNKTKTGLVIATQKSKDLQLGNNQLHSRSRHLESQFASHRT